MNYNQGKQQNQAYSGFRGTPFESSAQGSAYQANTNLSNVSNSMTNPAQGGGLNAQGQPQYQGFSGQQMLPGGQYGLGSNADPAVAQMMKTMFGFSSGNAAQRGQTAPENMSNVAGSAVTNALPSLIPQIQNWQQMQFGAPMQAGNYALNAAQAPAQQWGSSLGSQSSGSGSQFGFGVDPSKLIGTAVPAK